jgi:diguanylate cyclase (GGDEF)-like protein/PAS domain S-box-containing protein
MRRLLDRQIEKARAADGGVDAAALIELVDATYRELDRDRKRTDRAIEEMIHEVDTVQSRLRNAFDVVPEGLCLLDAQDRYVIWNKRYEEIYPPLSGRLTAGMKFEAALRLCIEAGMYPEVADNQETWLSERLFRHAQAVNVEEQHLPGGRWLRIEESRTEDGGSIGARVDITDLKEKEASFRLLFENNPVPMWVFDADTLRFLAVNGAALDHYGYSREQFASMTIVDIRPRDDSEALRRAVADTLESRRQDRLWRHFKADGSLIDVDIFGQRLMYQGRRAVLVASVDVTDRKRAEDQVRETHKFLDAIVESVPSTIFVKEPGEHRYILLNRAGELLFGRTRDAVVGHRDRDLFDEITASINEAREVELLNGDRYEIAGHETIDTPHAGQRLLSVNRRAICDDAGKPRYILGVAEDITEKRRAEERISFLAHHDALTGLPNRAAFMDRLAECIRDAGQSGQPFSILSIDLDRFKSINDVFGHPIGDLLLREVAARLLACGEGAFVARLGGDEFIMICRDQQQPEASERLGKNLKAAMAADCVLNEHRVRTSLSVGIAVFPADGRDGVTLLANADAALYRSKADGRDTVRRFEPEMDRRLRDQRSLRNDLVHAVERGELALAFQPQAKVGGSVLGFEALLRWTHPTRGAISPIVFIPLAEEGSLIDDISEWVLREACRTAASWNKPLTVAINLSPIQFRHDDLPSLVHRILLETGLSPGRLELEITESVLITDFTRTIGLLRRLKGLGVKIAMDDFGTGYSSLSYLQTFPFDKIKIDQSFISNLGRNDQSVAIVRAVIGLCRGLDLPVIAEGVETQEQLAFLTRERCNAIQGYLIGRPLPIEEYASIVGPTEQTIVA